MDQAISYLQKLPHGEVKPGLSRIEILLEAVGNPHERLCTVHIGGTNGKGSVAAMLASVLQTAGYRVGLYTSPHLISYRERIQINQEQISEREFQKLADELMPIADSMRDKPTQFEFLTALAFLYLARQQTEIAVIEVGLGGRFDATNVIKPLVSVLTNVELDHTDLLGDTIAKITWEKAGIAKPGVPLVTGECKREALEVIAHECVAVGTPLVGAYTPLRIRDFNWEYQEFEIEELGRVRLKLLGSYQQDNLAVALRALQVLQKYLRISSEAIIHGLEQVRWPGRFEISQHEPYVIVLDGAHNPHAARALREDLRRYRQKFSITQSVLLFGVLRDKNYREMVEILFPEFDALFFVKLDSPRTCEPSVLAQIVTACRGVWPYAPSIYEDVGAALKAARMHVPERGLLCITGSLYLVGAVKRLVWE